MPQIFVLFMDGTIVSFRRNRHSQSCSHIIIQPNGIESKDKAAEIVGKETMWQNPIGKNKVQIKGKVASTHGNKGCVRAIFERGLPGQALNRKVRIS